MKAKKAESFSAFLFETEMPDLTRADRDNSHFFAYFIKNT
jgi:hypothetical protein